MLLKICPNESGGFVNEAFDEYRENRNLSQSLLAMMQKLRMVPVYVRELIDEINTVTVSF